MRGICARGKQRCQRCSSGRVGWWTWSREGALQLHRRCWWDGLCKGSSAEVHLLAGCRQWLHNTCQHTLHGWACPRGVSIAGSHCSAAAPLSSICPTPALLYPPCFYPSTPSFTPHQPGTCLAAGCPAWLQMDRMQHERPLSSFAVGQMLLEVGTWFSFRDVALSCNFARAIPSSPCFPLSSVLVITGNEMPLLAKPNQTGRYMAIIPAESLSSEGSLWCSSES